MRSLKLLTARAFGFLDTPCLLYGDRNETRSLFCAREAGRLIRGGAQGSWRADRSAVHSPSFLAVRGAWNVLGAPGGPQVLAAKLDRRRLDHLDASAGLHTACCGLTVAPSRRPVSARAARAAHASALVQLRSAQPALP